MPGCGTTAEERCLLVMLPFDLFFYVFGLSLLILGSCVHSVHAGYSTNSGFTDELAIKQMSQSQWSVGGYSKQKTTKKNY